MSRVALLIVLLVAGLGVALPAAAQTASGNRGSVGSAVLNNGYPAAGGSVVAPNTGSTGATTPSTTTAATTTSTGGASGNAGSGSFGNSSSTGGIGSGTSAGGSAGGRSGTAGTTGGSRRSGSGGAHWVVCLPSGAPGSAGFFTGTDLSCAPD